MTDTTTPVTEQPSTEAGLTGLTVTIPKEDYDRLMEGWAQNEARRIREAEARSVPTRPDLTVERIGLAMARAGVHIDLRPSDTTLAEPCESCAAGVERILAALATEPPTE